MVLHETTRSLSVKVLCMIGGRRVGHLGHRVFFTTLENILDARGDIHLFVGSTDLTRRAVNNHIGHSK